VTGQTVHRLIVARVQCVIPERVGKAFMLIMTKITDMLLLLQHADPIRTVKIVTVGTGIPVRMFMQVLFLTCKGVGMTVTAGGADIFRQQALPIADVRIMTADAWISLAGNPQMIVRKIEAAQHILMALQTAFDAKLLTMADATIILAKRRMTDLSHQVLGRTTMGMMTSETIYRLHLPVQVLLL
jgi:hypothetical protein